MYVESGAPVDHISLLGLELEGETVPLANRRLSHGFVPTPTVFAPNITILDVILK